MVHAYRSLPGMYKVTDTYYGRYREQWVLRQPGAKQLNQQTAYEWHPGILYVSSCSFLVSFSCASAPLTNELSPWNSAARSSSFMRARTSDI